MGLGSRSRGLRIRRKKQPRNVRPDLSQLQLELACDADPRVGYAFDKWLVYGKAGGAWADVSVSVNGPFGIGSSACGTASGWVAGVGAEYAFRNNWSAKVEYKVFDFGSESGTFITGNSVTLQTVKVGANYRFGGWPF